jgi:hypothetical protein
MMAGFVFVIVGAITYVWVVRGFFSALVHLACTLVAGAIAFAFWEPLGNWLLNAAPDRGTMAFLRDSPWAIAIAVPFALSLGILRFATNKLLPANAKCEDVVDYVGGGLCGLASGAITAGFFMIAVGFLRFGPGAAGFQPVRYTAAAEGRGSIEREPGFMVGAVPRFDTLTVRLYETLSMTTLRTSEPLGKWYPRFDDVPWANRMTYGGRGRNTIRARDFTVQGWYTVGRAPNDNEWRGGPMAPLMQDVWNPTTSQTSVDMDGNRISSGYIAGFKTKLSSGAKEKQGQIIVGNGQVRLIVESVTEEDFKSLHPVAVVTNVGIEGLAQDQEPASARFRFDGNEVFFCSVGGASDATMWFEFAVPSGYKPIGLSIKNMRWEMPEGMAPTTYQAAAERDAAVIALGGVMSPPGGAAANPLTPTTEVPNPEVIASNSIGQRIQRGSHGTLATEETDRTWWIIDGEYTFSMKQLRESSQGLEANLVIDRFAVTNDTVIVKVDVSVNSPASILGSAADSADPNSPLVVEDTNGVQYEAVGYTYSDGEKYSIRFTVGQPLRGLTELNSSGVMISKSRPNQELKLVFRPTLGVKLRAFKIGAQTIRTWDPPIELNTPQKRR